MRILLDENFPIQLFKRLQQAGYEAEHIIALGLRGLSDDVIRLRLATEADLVFLTQDTEFAALPAATAAIVMISRVPQAIPIARRVELWLHAIDDFFRDPSPGQAVRGVARWAGGELGTRLVGDPTWPPTRPATQCITQAPIGSSSV